MKFGIQHKTAYSYSMPVNVCQNVVVLQPRESEYVKVLSHRIKVLPSPQYSCRRLDCFGNHVYVFAIEENHKQLAVTAMSEVELLDRELPAPQATPEWEKVALGIRNQTDARWFDAVRFCFDSPRIRRSKEFAEFARPSFTARRPILQAAIDLSERIHAEFAYDKDATHVFTTPEDALRLKRGVCQDFAHVYVAAARSLGLAARYVSGYLRTIPPPGEKRKVGADESHAWVSLYCGAECGWVDLDPTNPTVRSHNRIPFAWGRDYRDVVPFKGVFLGGGNHALRVSVDVTQIES